MDTKRILTIQDISCVGQCSLTVALPILSACGFETAILPSAVLSTHTAGFSGFTFRDLTEDFPAIEKHWNKEEILFDAVYTGYLGSTKQIDYVKSIIRSSAKKHAVRVIDPAMGDNGKLYPIFNDEYVQAMKGLCKLADIVVPNITEACFLTGTEYREVYDEEYILNLLKKQADATGATVVLTGVSYRKAKTGVAVYKDGGYSYYEHRQISKGCHGTGDVYASAFVGALMNGKNEFESAKIAADYVVLCIKNTQNDPDHWYGVKFEPVLGKLIKMVRK